MDHLPTPEERRLQFDNELRTLLDTTNTYFQPPATVRMSYPCVVYNRLSMDEKRADDRHYTMRPLYSLTVIDRNPDSDWVQRLLDHFPYSRYDRHYVADGLNHDTLSIYY